MKPPQRPSAPKTRAVLIALRQGHKLTVAVALRKLGVYALSQEAGRLKRLGWDIKRRMVSYRGSRVAEYSL